MGTIHVLDRLLSDMIAAGEVVERPSSVVKELFENAKDAGAGRITVEIEEGGKKRISVTDDGVGMDREDAVLSVVRYATSKLKTKEDLFSIATMGFRGEALASICAVSKMTIITRKEEALSGTMLICEGGEVTSVEDIGCPVGTKITVENLFYNTPARLKFLKKDATEGAYIEEIVARLILSNPHLSIKFVKDGRQVYYSKGDNDIRSAVYAVYGSQLSEQLIMVDAEKNGVRISGCVGSPNLARPTRKFEHFSVNGRICKSKILIQALEYAYFQKMAQGKYPFCALDIQVDYTLCDVNVHPQKAEVKFSDEQSIYDAVYSAVKEVIEAKLFVKETKTVPIATSKAVQYGEPKTYQQRSFLSKEPVSVKTEAPKKQEPIFNQVNDFTFMRESKSDEKPATAIKKEPIVNESVIPKKEETQNIIEETKEIKVEKEETIVIEPLAEIIPQEPKIVEEAAETIPEKIEEPQETFRVIGQVFSSYILIEKGDELLLLDQHAAHERLNYEKIHQQMTTREVYSQLLLVPKIIEFAPTDYRLMLEHLELLQNVGIMADDFSDNSIVVREIPCEVKEKNIEKLLYEILEEIKKSGKVLPENFNLKLLFLVACKMSVKANTELSMYQMEELVKEAFSLNGKTTCPHGRPLFISFSKTTIETKFER
ncbi:MAG: DNA mismatch repair endonuclease MutL [Ruminococcaceae bacterium]|nr:DNA mismatch repair endonuclease MutL [Oscillospiraceae bacterium]